MFKRKIMSQLPNCPKCGSEYTYEDGYLYICPECDNEWSQDESSYVSSDTLVVKDANAKEFIGKNEVKAKNIDILEEKSVKPIQNDISKKAETKSNNISNNDEWESF